MTWPILRTYRGEHLSEIALPVGGIGTGTVSLGGRGQLRDWEVVNRPAKLFMPANTFFALWTPGATRAIEGALVPPFGGQSGATAHNHNLPRFRECSFHAAYPLGQVLLSDPDVPLRVRIEAFNPLIPGDADGSGIPVAVLRFVLQNPTRNAVPAAVCGSFQNAIGSDGTTRATAQNRNEFRNRDGLRGIVMTSASLEPSHPQYGTVVLATTARPVTHRTAWLEAQWAMPLLDFWDDFSSDGRLEPRQPGRSDTPTGSLSVRSTVPARGQRAITFLLAWHFPNRLAWTGDGVIGNHYATRFEDAWDVARRTSASLATLESRTVSFVESVVRSDLPLEVKDAALSNLVALRSQTSFRTPDGKLFGWEGCFDKRGCCEGSCTHVWNYDQATPFLFGELAVSMREVELEHATRASGLMSFRTLLPLAEKAQEWAVAAADGQMGCVIKLFREWQLSGDDDMLRRLWPHAKRALEFAWIPGGWDADRDGVMEGCQHNTMDVEYYGPNPQTGLLYLAALRSASTMAAYVGDDGFASECGSLFASGSRWLDEHLFNGEYYEHEIRPPAAEVAEGLRHPTMGARTREDPDFQLGRGCLVDQLFGQLLAHIAGLGYLVKQSNVRRTLESVRRYNFRSSFFDHFNPMRTYAVNDESGLLMASYPRGERPTAPFPYYAECMTGFEYTAAVGMLYEGLVEQALECIRAVRDRHDGRRRNPFDEAECGHHYARAMASWAGILALTGFGYSAVTKTLRFNAVNTHATWFWSNGRAWGTITQRPAPRRIDVTLDVKFGSLRVKTLELAAAGRIDLDRPRTMRGVERFTVPR